MFKINFEQICPLFRVNSPIFVEERKTKRTHLSRAVGLQSLEPVRVLVPAAERRFRVVFVQSCVQNRDLCLQVLGEEFGRFLAGDQKIDIDTPQRVVQEIRICNHKEKGVLSCYVRRIRH